MGEKVQISLSWGVMDVIWDQKKGIRYLSLPEPAQNSISALEGEILALRNALEEYFQGKRRELDFPLDLSGLPPFQRKVLEATGKIPYGETRSYQWVAQQAGSPRACRAVGGALGKNPVPILIPCHRVVGSDGSLCGFSGPGGLDQKKRLLELEGIKVDKQGKIK
ncbi:methylated-DNA--[protein]-cysteine S-methyltransferase [Candidatus Formimonas warabiya]|uniref:Methylated-DNA--protein-cysteine methyltransferase n=1 Tax=Formimonas warabiya TaxID=1761012 RepID=A0A3G1KXY9_FORW1|nr:methylated-DNA--[protein]-cysteine S-methyltransferase [Candidatus Formimonas warabiya]ATW27229.1 hypothetical protein DCMF_22940 [Candidatus Formimonas warabiya]